MVTEETLKLSIDEYVKDSANFLVNLSISPKKNIIIEMDGDEGFKISDCINLSKFIKNRFGESLDSYSLEVTSYGIGNKLILPRQYKKSIGRLLRVSTKEQSGILGRITEATDDTIELQLIKERDKKGVRSKQVSQKISLYYRDIMSAVVEVEFK